MIRRTLITLMALAALAAVAGTAAPTAAAASAPCWKRLLNDWYGDHRIDGSYPVSCYRDAIRNLPEDVDAYTEAREDIQRALLAAIRRSPSGTLQPTDVVPPEPAPPSRPGSGGGGNGNGGNGSGDGEAPGDDDTTDTVAGPAGGGDDGLIGFFRPSNADEIPIPLLALAALALVLLAAAAASFVARRIQSRRLQPEPIRTRPAPPEA
jgi:hypothetical protein